MADRTVSVKLRADVSGYIRSMRNAAAATKELTEQTDRIGNRAAGDFAQTEEASGRLEQALRRLAAAERQLARSQQQSTTQTRRSSDETRRQAGEVERGRQAQDSSRQSTDRSTESLGRYRRETEQSRLSLGRFSRQTQQTTQTAAAGGASTAAWITSLVAAVAGISPAASAAAISVAGFTALAAPSIIKVVGAQQDLTHSWVALDDQQQVSALLVHNLADQYKGLAESYEPQALQSFNSVVLSAASLMPLLQRVVDDSGAAVQDLGSKIGRFAEGPEMSNFIRNAGQQAPQALNLLGDAAVDAGNTAINLAGSLVPTGLSLLTATRGVLGFASAATHVSPALTEMAVTALLLRGPTMALSGLYSRAAAGAGAFAAETRGASMASRAIMVGGGFTTYTGAMRNFAAETGRASVASRALNLVTRAGPGIYIAAGVALAYLAVRMSSVRDSTDGMIDRLRAESKAFGNNLSGHEQYAAALKKEADAANAAAVQNTEAMTTSDGLTGSAVNASNKISAAYQKELTAINHIKEGQAALSAEFHISADSATRLASAAGVDLSAGVLKAGELTEQARQKITQYKLAVDAAADSNRQLKLGLEQAADSSLLLKDRVAGLSAAYDAQLNPSLAVFQATLQVKDGFQKLSTQMNASKASMNGNNAASIQLQQAFGQQIGVVQALHTATFQQTHDMGAANRSVAAYIPVLYAMAGGSDRARAQVDALAKVVGFNSSRVMVSRNSFIAQASAMGLSKARAAELWTAYQRLAGATNLGSRSLSSYISRLRTSAEAARVLAIRTGNGTGAQHTYNSRISAALPVLYALAGRNSAARAQVDALARSTGHATGITNTSRAAFLNAASAMGIGKKRAADLWKELQKIKSRSVKVDVDAKGHWQAAGYTFNPSTTAGRATGGPIPQSWAIGSGGPTEDDVPLWASVGEHMVTAAEVRAVGGHDAMYRLRQAMLRGELRGFRDGGKIPGFARGGAIGNTSLTYGSGSGEAAARPAVLAYDSTVFDLSAAMAGEWKKFAGSGGPVVAVARQQIGKPYVWGATGPDAFDCSGLTWYAWKHGAGKDISRTTYTQRSALSTISTPIPGAVGQPHPGHTYLYAGAGRIIEAAHTGTNIRETSVRGGEWWGYPKARGGPVTAEEAHVGDRFLKARSNDGNLIIVAKALHIAGDPGGLGLPGYAAGGSVGERHEAQIAPPGARLWAEPETGGEAYIPLASGKRARSTAILGAVANRFGLKVTAMSDGGILSFADGGLTDTPDLNLGDILQRWSDAVGPATAADVTSAKKGVTTQTGQVDSARRALAKAEQSRRDRLHDAEKRLDRALKSHNKTRIADAKEDLAKAKRTDTIRAAEARLKKERSDLADATKKLQGAERRYKAGAISPAAKLSGALSLNIKNTGAFIANLTKLADRGFGLLAQQLLAMGGADAEQIAADAVKFSDAKLKGLQGQLQTSQKQQQTLQNLPNILAVRSSLKTLGVGGGSWTALLNATGMGPGDLAAAVHLIEGDLAKTVTGRALLADMKAHGYARGGWVSGRSGVDRVPAMLTDREFVVAARPAAKHAPLLEAINSDRVGQAMLRHYATGGWVGPVRGGDGAATTGGATVNQTFVHQEMSTSQLAREAAREAAWMIR